ncbi:type IV toxin-antitoxin system AbiEi family antitoxin domain-containing protein [Pseudonocardia endophytica]|uniref:type IV toxin-antitoxin system AbiEi family antitoxin domain-containing protein n=1 Tax=Pseudonocardia endophytica TaxID=401976 RepID=UPI00104F0F27|nr:type IV toxin-antitoxin system AbiEi family antitoxin domain-containing protein [Pseudonocardia endophytica]
MDAALHATLLRQAGVITRAQALAAGLSADAVDRRLAARRWHPVHPRVYRDGAFPATEEATVRAAVLWGGPGAVLSGTAAAWWHGLLREPPVTVGLTVPRRRYPRPRAGLTVRRRELAAADVRTVAGLPVVAAPLAALETAVELGARGPGFLEELLAAGRVGPDAAGRAHGRQTGSHGAASAGRVLGIALRGVRFRARRRLGVLLGADGPSGWVRERQVAGLPLELAHPVSRTAVEVSFPSPSGDDERTWRKAVLRRQGWSVVTVDPCDVLARPDDVVERIEGAVRPEPTGPAGAAVRVVS